MKHIRFYLDFISPYAYLAFVELPRTLEGLSYAVHTSRYFLADCSSTTLTSVRLKCR